MKIIVTNYTAGFAKETIHFKGLKKYPEMVLDTFAFADCCVLTASAESLLLRSTDSSVK